MIDMRIFKIFLLTVLTNISTSSAADKPDGRFLYQPKLIWGNSKITHQGTGYLLKHDNRYFGVTSTHFLDFEAGGLSEAVWVDIRTMRPVLSFRNSLGKPERTEIKLNTDIAHDFVLMPTETLPTGCKALEIESVNRYAKGTRLWFPNKSLNGKFGYEWVEAEVVEDVGPLIVVKLLADIELRSQSGSPFLNQKNGRVIGMLFGGDKDELILCPARSLVKRLKSNKKSMSLLTSINTNAKGSNEIKKDENVLTLSGKDNGMNAAILKAQKNFPVFKEALVKNSRRVLSVIETSLIKYAFPAAKNGVEVEHMFLSDIHWNGSEVIGTLNSEPMHTDSVKLGEKIAVDPKHITDWLFIYQGKTYGGYTFQYMWTTFSKEEQKAYRNQAPFVWLNLD